MEKNFRNLFLHFENLKTSLKKDQKVNHQHVSLLVKKGKKQICMKIFLNLLVIKERGPKEQKHSQRVAQLYTDIQKSNPSYDDTPLAQISKGLFNFHIYITDPSQKKKKNQVSFTVKI